MRRSRDGGGIRLSCSHVSQSDTRSLSWQGLAANLFRDSVFQLVSEISTPRPRAQNTEPLALQTERRPVPRAACASRAQNTEPLALQTEHPPEPRAAPKPRSPNPQPLALQITHPPEPRATVASRSPNPSPRALQTTHPPEPRANTDTPHTPR